MSADKVVQSRPRWRVAIVDDHERSRSALRAAIWAAAGLPDGDGVQTAAQLTAADYPVVLFTSHTDGALVERARAAGIMAYLLKPLRAAELAPALDLAIARFAETRQLRQTLEDRKVIERAKGTLMTRFGLTEDEAFKRLRRAAMDSRKPMVEVARALLVSESVIS